MNNANRHLVTLFEAALDCPSEAERSANLDRACGDNGQLRARLDALLRAHAAAGQFLDPDTEDIAATRPPETMPAPAPGVGHLLASRYKLLEMIGEGGMGTVWMAEQQEPVRRTVALKLIKPGMDSKQVLARFEAERQALALMDHPNIAQVYDAGATPDGRPYFVMELVKGVQITTFCDERRLTLRERLELFVPVCQAVQHAHQKGVIHRDLKPSNVLVALYDGRPVPKVIDFGVAKAAGQKLTDETLHTGFGAVVGTLEYMSPEQAELNQLDIDTRSDIYSLGVLLYELLTGTTPLERARFKEAALLEMLRRIREDEPPKPSHRLSTVDELPSIAANRGVEPKRLTGLVRGELDWIVMKALEKDRNRRYETASGLAADLLRFLADEPISAGPPSRLYRLRKFIRRNRGAVFSAGLLFGSLVTGIGVSTWQAVRATAAQVSAQKERDAANAARAAEADERDKAEAIQGFFEDEILEQANPVRQAALDHVANPNVKLRTILDRAAVKIEGAFHDRPKVEGSIRKTIGESYLALHEPNIARPHLERALAICRQEYGEGHRYTLNLLGDVAMCSLYEGKFAEALDRLQNVAASVPEAYPANDPARITLLNNLAMAHDGMGQHERAVELLQQAIAGYREVIGENHIDAISAMNNLALAYQHLRHFDQAELWALRAIERARSVQGEASPIMLVAMFNLLTTYSEQGQFKRGLPYVDPLLKFAPQVFGDDHPRMVDIWNNVGEVLIETRDDVRLEPVLVKLMEHGPKIRGENHHQTIMAMNEMALLHVRKERYAEAEPLFVICLDRLIQTKGPNDETIATGLNSLIYVLEKQNKHAAAEPRHRQLVEVERKRHGPDSQVATQAAYQLGRCLIRQKKFADAEPVFRDCLKVFEKGKPSGWTYGAQKLLGESLAGQKKYADAEPLILAGYRGFLALEPTPQHKQIVLDILELIVRFYDDWGKNDEAVKWRKTLTEAKAVSKR